MGILKDRGLDRISQLEGVLSASKNLQNEIDALNELAWEIRLNHRGRAYEISQKAGDLSSTGEYSEKPYIHGLSASLVTQAFMDTYDGKLDMAVSKCLQALNLLQGGGAEIEIKIWFTLGWNCFFLGDYPAALENGIKALNLAREMGDRLHEAWSLDAVASFHGITGDFENAIPLHEKALQIFRDLKDVIGEMRTLNNLAVSLCEMKQYERAYSECEISLRLARLFELDMDVCNNSCTLADILIGMDRLEEAEACLQESMEEIYGSSVAHVNVLQRVGYLHLLKSDLGGAEMYTLQALELADRLDQRAEQANCHEMLSRIFEKQLRFSDALAHYRRFHELQNMIQGEQAANRLAALKITHQVENARHEAEIYRLEAVELQRKFDEQKVVQRILEFQNTIDPMTGLYNRRYFDEVLLKEYSRHSRSGAELSLLMMDVDNFKFFNDTYGHVSGDLCLQQIAVVIKNSITRPPDVAARYGGEEFICLLPETGLEGGKKVAEIIRLEVMKLAIPHARSGVADVVTISIGMVTSICVKGGVATDLVIQADAQLYAAKSNGRNRVVLAHAP